MLVIWQQSQINTTFSDSYIETKYPTTLNVLTGESGRSTVIGVCKGLLWKKEKKLLTTPLALSQPKALETYDRRIATVVPYYPVFKPPSDLRPRLKSEFKPTRLKYGPIFSIRENAKTSQVQLSFSIKY